ncbi:MAG: hypothetical protein CDV28_101133 [Candidatus Electronema aureum]|uniref:Uncharacterized protein n=1 Tax=Candidatus Electronema aureum TaxID=2005002 RepID=A0A521G5D1_9BACT|nr:MAG: hypothetical protein CDV28_101133 [Candidatus Electronema aureum]
MIIMTKGKLGEGMTYIFSITRRLSMLRPARRLTPFQAQAVLNEVLAEKQKPNSEPNK